MFSKFKKTHLGFTLIELIVVIAIVSILSAVVLINLNTSRIRSRDIRRATDIRQIQVAVELYADVVGHYPNSAGVWTSFDSPGYSPNPIYSPNAANLTAALAPYINSAGDPKNLGGDSGYLYISPNPATDYCILFWRTPENLKNYDNSLVNYGRCTGGIDNNGQCIGNLNSIYIGTGPWAGGC